MAVVLALAPPALAADDLPSLLQRLDTLHPRRHEAAVRREQRELIEGALARFPEAPQLWWRAARALFWDGDDPDLPKEQRSAFGKRGWELAHKASAALPNEPAGHYYAALNIGNHALALGVIRALREGVEGKFKASLERAQRLAPEYEHGGVQVAWGRFYMKLPWPKRDANKAEQHLRSALAIQPKNLRAKVYLAELLFDEDRAQEATQLLQSVRQAKPGSYDFPEETRYIALAARMLRERK